MIKSLKRIIKRKKSEEGYFRTLWIAIAALAVIVLLLLFMVLSL